MNPRNNNDSPQTLDNGLGCLQPVGFDQLAHPTRVRKGSGKIGASAQLLNSGRVVEAACLILDVRMPH